MYGRPFAPSYAVAISPGPGWSRILDTEAEKTPPGEPTGVQSISCCSSNKCRETRPEHGGDYVASGLHGAKLNALRCEGPEREQYHPGARRRQSQSTELRRR